MDRIVNEILEEIERAKSILPEGFEESNSRNDFIAYINAYTGRAAEKVLRNEREEQEFRSNMVKAAGLAISAILAYDNGSI